MRLRQGDNEYAAGLLKSCAELQSRAESAERKKFTKGQWLVMDGRARFDTDDAAVLEAMGPGVLEQPPRRAAAREWHGYDACLCFCRATVKKNRYAIAEYVEDVI